MINLIYGPPGTGKTTTLMKILEKELGKVAPDKIAYVSFTRQGTYEGTGRARELYGLSKEDVPYFRTLHSIAYRELGVTPDRVIDKNHYKQLSNRLGMSFMGYYTEDLKHNDDQYLFYDSLIRNNDKAALDYPNNMDKRKLKLVRQTYKNYKNSLGVYDFTDMIVDFVKSKRTLPVEVAIIDEAQDLTSLQWKMVWTAFANASRIYIAGDDDQAVYEWSGADVRYFLSIKGNQTILEQSYRLPKTVYNYARKISSLINNRIQKPFNHAGELGEINILTSLKELAIDNNSSWLFLARNNKDLTKVTKHLRAMGLPYWKKGKKSISKKIVDAILTYEGMRRGETGKYERELHRLWKLCDYQLTGFSEPWYSVFKMSDDERTYYRDIFANKSDITNINIRVDTIHSCKGSEADNVVLLTDISQSVKANYDRNPDAEYRVLYVAVTRAKRYLYLIEPTGKNHLPYLI